MSLLAAYRTRRLALWLAASAAPAVGMAATAETAPPVPMSAPRPPADLTVVGEPPPPPLSVTDLKFRDLCKLPVGPYGLEPTEKLLGLDGNTISA